ncbi:PAS domain S-box protein [Metallumcola ferriviriculae]|uniref:histidine kinase n=1 Tax=Metallumcola ferriviriculae TaxID=3039180 RepID=A0AAU0UNP2_9FIRM|nr:PAS domain S-box protein [Desulfitibacteraceae bacterium MK1]
MKRLSLAFRLVFYYMIFAAMWILVSDWLLASIFKDTVAITKLQNFKGVFYVLLTGGLLYLKLRREFGMRHEVENDLRRHRDQLEKLVAERTTKLAAANQRLVEEISKQKQIEEELRQSNGRYRQLVELSPDVIIVHSDEVIVFANKVAAEFFRIKSTTELMGKSIGEFLHPDYHQASKQRIRMVLSGLTAPLTEFKVFRADGNTVDVEVKSIPFVHQGKPAVQTVVRDITERKRLEEEVLRSSKLESIGFLAGGISHDFNNILTIILGNVSLAKGNLDEAAFMLDRLSEIEKAAVQAKDLTGGLLAFAKGDEPVKMRLAFGHLLKETISLALSGSNVKCKFDIADNLRLVEADPSQISQVINNVVINAVQAMSNGGNVYVSAENVTVWPRSITAREAGSYVRITFRDEGPGVSQDNLQKIFDPYFTTKEHGSGLGLAVTYSIVKKHGGHIIVDSSQGRGVAFHIYLPAVSSKEDCGGDCLKESHS